MCGKFLPLSSFNKHSRSKDGHQNFCRDCNKKKVNEWDSCPRNRRRRKLRKKYGITLEDYDQMLKNQDYKCKICGTTETRNKSTEYLVVDHCHKSKKVRGLLCDYCNVGLGRFEDNTERMQKAIEYLRSNK